MQLDQEVRDWLVARLPMSSPTTSSSYAHNRRDRESAGFDLETRFPAVTAPLPSQGYSLDFKGRIYPKFGCILPVPFSNFTAVESLSLPKMRYSRYLVEAAATSTLSVRFHFRAKDVLSASRTRKCGVPDEARKKKNDRQREARNQCHVRRPAFAFKGPPSCRSCLSRRPRPHADPPSPQSVP